MIGPLEYLFSLYHILQPQGLLERHCGNTKYLSHSKGLWKCGPGLAKEAGHLADLPPCPTAHSTTKKFNIATPNEVHQADLLFLPHDRLPQGRKTYKYALTIVDVASRYKEAEPLASKDAKDVAEALSRIYRRSPLKWPKLLQVDPGREFMGAVNQLLAKHDVESGEVVWTSTGTRVSCSNRTMAERLFGHQYAQEMRLPSWERSSECVARLPAVVAALNGEVTRLSGKRPFETIKARSVTQKPSFTLPGRPVDLRRQRFPSGVGVRYLYQPGELEGGRRRATDPVWSLTVHRLGRSVTKPGEPVLYYLQDGTQRGFVREELLLVPPDTQLPPDGVLPKA